MAQRTYRDPDQPGKQTTLGELDRRVDFRGRHRCVRCGGPPPAPELFICVLCQVDPDQVAERRKVEEAETNAAEQRRMLVELYGWRGGWWR